MTSLPFVAVNHDAVPLSLAQSCFWLPLSWNTVLSTHSHYVHKAPSPCGKSQLACQPSTELLQSGPYLQPVPPGKATLPDVRAAMSLQVRATVLSHLASRKAEGIVNGFRGSSRTRAPPPALLFFDSSGVLLLWRVFHMVCTLGPDLRIERGVVEFMGSLKGL